MRGRFIASILAVAVVAFVFSPHIQILFDVKTDQGNIEHWSSIGDNPVNLRRKGWNSNTIKSNDQITISGYPAKEGRPLMTTNKIVLNGKELD